MTIYKGWNAKLYYNGGEIGHATDIKVDIDHSLELYFEAGSRVPALSIEGPINIAGKLSRAWIDNTYLSLLSGTSTLTSFTISVNVNSRYLYLYNCKFKKGSVAVPQDGILTEDYDFIALSLAIV